MNKLGIETVQELPPNMGFAVLGYNIYDVTTVLV